MPIRPLSHPSDGQVASARYRCTCWRCPRAVAEFCATGDRESSQGRKAAALSGFVCVPQGTWLLRTTARALLRCVAISAPAAGRRGRQSGPGDYPVTQPIRAARILRAPARLPGRSQGTPTAPQVGKLSRMQPVPTAPDPITSPGTTPRSPARIGHHLTEAPIDVGRRAASVSPAVD